MVALVDDLLAATSRGTISRSTTLANLSFVERPARAGGANLKMGQGPGGRSGLRTSAPPQPAKTPFNDDWKLFMSVPFILDRADLSRLRPCHRVLSARLTAT
jgi:hypothetical protein